MECVCWLVVNIQGQIHTHTHINTADSLCFYIWLTILFIQFTLRLIFRSTRDLFFRRRRICEIFENNYLELVQAIKVKINSTMLFWDKVD